LNVTFFIAQRLGKANKKTFTALAQRVGIWSVALGLTTILLSFLVINGFEKNIEHKLTHFQGELQLFKYSIHRTIEEIPLPTSKISHLRETFPAIESLTAFAHKTVLLQSKEATEGVVCKGIDLQASPHEAYQAYITAGRYLDPTPTPYSHEIILSTTLANKLQVQVGDTLMACVMQPTLRYRKLKIVGLYNTHVEELDQKIALCDLQLIQRLNSWPDSLVGGYDIFLQHGVAKSSLADSLLDWLGYDLEIRTLEEAHPAIFDWISLMKKDVWVFLSLILLVAYSNIICIVIIQTIEKASMIGLLSAMGASKRLIQGILLWNNAKVILYGMLVGNALGLGLAKLQDTFQFLHLDPSYYYIPYVPIAWSWKAIIALNALLITLLALVLCIALALVTRARPMDNISLRQG
jgi:lipoprotein-releasing system permease protein